MKYSKSDYLQVENAIRLLTHLFHDSSNSKPVLLHSIRVGTQLLRAGYQIEIVIAGYMHDVLEDTPITEAELADQFGAKIAHLVASNTKDAIISERTERHEELIARCIAQGEQAAIVKAADILDNYEYYSSQSDEYGIDYCTANAKRILEAKPASFTDPIFTELAKITRLG